MEKRQDKNVKIKTVLTVSFKKFVQVMREAKVMKNWSKETAKKYIEKIDKAKSKRGLTYWSAIDYLKHHRTMYSII